MNNYMFPYGYNPLISTQQRLQQMEQQYPQFAQPNNMQMQVNSPYIKCRAVTSYDEAKAALIDLDGSLHVFVDAANRKIYTKQINLDGTASLNSYSLETPSDVSNIPNKSFVSTEIFDKAITSLNKQIADLEEKFNQRSDEYVQPNANVYKPAKRKSTANDSNDDAVSASK